MAELHKHIQHAAGTQGLQGEEPSPRALVYAGDKSLRRPDHPLSWPPQGPRHRHEPALLKKRFRKAEALLLCDRAPKGFKAEEARLEELWRFFLGCETIWTN